MASSKDTLTEKDMHNLALTWQCFIGGEPAVSPTSLLENSCHLTLDFAPHFSFL